MRSPPARRSRWSITIDWCLAPHRWGSYITHSDAPQLVRLLCTSAQLVTETSTWQHTTLTTDIHALGGIRTHDLSRRAAGDLRLRPSRHWDRQGLLKVLFQHLIWRLRKTKKSILRGVRRASDSVAPKYKTGMYRTEDRHVFLNVRNKTPVNKNQLAATFTARSLLQRDCTTSQQVPPKCWYLFIKLPDVTMQDVVILLVTVVRT
jgi:hypothetical protein